MYDGACGFGMSHAESKLTISLQAKDIMSSARQML